MAGAWDCYRAILRMYVHLRRRERLTDRLRADLNHGELQQRLAKWAGDPRTTIPQLRRALEEVVACRPRPEWDAFTLKREYLDLMRFLDGPVNPPPEQIEEELTYRLGDVAVAGRSDATAPQHQAPARREPERSRRVIRLLFANWLAHVENTDPRQRRPAVRARFHIAQRTTSVVALSRQPRRTGRRRALSPQEVASWLVTTNDARVAFAVSGYAALGRPFAGGNSAAIGSCSCSWPVSSITASAAPSRLRKTPWSGPISRACPTTVRPSSAMKRRRPSRIPQARPSRRRGDSRRLRGRSAMSKPALVSRIAVCGKVGGWRGNGLCRSS